MTSNAHEKVLLVEDSKSFASILIELIGKHHGFEVDLAIDLAATKRLLEENANEYFASIVDYHLPDAPEGEAIDLSVSAGVPTVVFTGKSGSAMEEDLWSKGIADYANKHGTYNLEYVTWMVKRLYLNRSVEVLVVDDSSVARKSIARLLKRQSFKVHMAESGEEALKVLEANPGIRISVIDCNMEGMSGFALTMRVRETYSRAKMEVIGISSQGGRSMAAEFIKSGASDFILKPLIPEEFLCRVNNAVDRIDAYFELDKLNKLKNQFLGTAAHDIRGPLGSIKTASDFLLKRTSSPERTEKLLNMINSSSIDLLELLETLLDISVIESGVPKLSKANTNVSDALLERIELYQSEASSKGITIRQKIASNAEACVDPIKIKQAFDNLITNAIKYSETDSTVSIKLERKDDALIFSIQDAGPGITTEEQAHLFQAFSVLSTKATGGEKKTGLGLAITKSIIDAHEGTISYRHDNDTHSTFSVTLPLNS
ncbi:MAG: hybrid sensor histidine kinase/response regulator [Agarilytica sp.]